jgi:hypothetical protein
MTGTVFLIAAATASDLIPALRQVSIAVALIAILSDGGSG